MRKFTNPLDNIRVASPCPANWDEMYGNDRKRFCGACKLNVYNLSDMTRQDAENLLMNSEGRLCVRFFRRADGTVLTQNCPVGWQAFKRRVSAIVTAVFSIIIGFSGGVLSMRVAQSAATMIPDADTAPARFQDIPEKPFQKSREKISFGGAVWRPRRAARRYLFLPLNTR